MQGAGRVPGIGGSLGVPDDVSASRQSFQQALDNPCEYFIDVMWPTIICNAYYVIQDDHYS